MRMDKKAIPALLNRLGCALLAALLLLPVLPAAALTLSDGNLYGGGKYTSSSYGGSQTVMQANIDRAGDLLLYFSLKLADGDDYVGVSFYSGASQSGSVLHTIHFGRNPVVPGNNGVSVAADFDTSAKEIVVWWDSKSATAHAFMGNALLKSWSPAGDVSLGSAKSLALFTGPGTTGATFAYAYAAYPLAAMIGDSITAGVGAGDLGGNNIPKLLGNYLKSRGIWNYFIANKGVGGNTSEQIKNRFTSDVLLGTGCDYAFIQGGINDFWMNNAAATVANKKGMADLATAAGVTPFIIGVMPTLSGRLDFSIALNNAEKTSYAGYHYIDVWDALDGSPKDNVAVSNLMDDALHPNAAGAAAVVSEISSYSSSVLTPEHAETAATVSEGDHGMVTGDKVLFRKSPTTSDYWDYLNTGWVAKVLSTTSSGGHTWYRVETNIPVALNRTYVGYVRGDFFRMLSEAEEASWLVSKPQPFTGATGVTPPPATATPAPSGEYAKVTASGFNLRQTADSGGASLGVLFEDQVVRILEKTSADWYRVQAGSLQGYFPVSALRILSAQEVAELNATPTPGTGAAGTLELTLPGKTNLRRTPAGESIWQYEIGTVLPYYGQPVYSSGYYWAKVTDPNNGLTGYIRSDCYVIKTGGAVTPTNTPAPTQGASGNSVRITLGGVNLRQAPAGAVLAVLDRGRVLPYYGTPTPFGSYSWVYVYDSASQQYGYVRSDCYEFVQGGTPAVTPAPTPSATPAQGMMGYIVTIKSEINLRSGPNASAILGRVDKGLVLPLLGPVQNAGGYNWFQVNPSGTTGFLRGDCVRQMTTGEINEYLLNGTIPSLTPPTDGGTGPVTSGFVLSTDQVQVRRTASTDATVIGNIPSAGLVYPYYTSVTAGGRTWHKISFNGQEGYVMASYARLMTVQEYTDYVNSLPTPTPPPAPTATPRPEDMSSTAITRLEKVIVRSGAGATNSELTILYRQGTLVQLQGPTAQADGQTWYQVRVSGVTGWIRGDLLRVLTKVEEAIYNQTGDPDSPKTATYRTLQLGSSGEDVTRLQQELNRLGYLNAVYVTGVYNDQTAEAVRKYQGDNGLFVDGIAGGNTQHKLYNTVPEGTYEPGGGSTVTVTLNPVELVDWVTSDISTYWGRGETAVMTDVKTNISLRVRRWAGGSHVDGEPLTSADSAALSKIYGVKNTQEILEKNLYQRRPVWITIKGRTFAASLYGVPHNYPDGDAIAGNDFNGQLCVHFLNSRVHSTGTVDADHMRAIQEAYNAAPVKK